MSWNQLSFDVPDDLTDVVFGELSEQGASGIWEPGEPTAGLTRIVAYFDSRSDLEQIRAALYTLFDRAHLAFPAISISVIEETDWTGEWKKSYTSFPIGKNFFVVPSWSESSCPDDRLPIYIDPGQAFGTGTHETTQLTLEALERWLEHDHQILDLGTGSGILAIASRMLGARDVLACDIDPVAIQVACENMTRNAAQEVRIMCGSIDAVRANSVDLLLCNLTAEMIIRVFPEIDRVLRHKALVIFSGILNTQREDIREVMDRSGYAVHEELTRGEWLAIVTQKNVA